MMNQDVYKVNRSVLLWAPAFMDPEGVIEELSRGLDIQLKDKQQKAILAVLKGNDIFAILPTGYRIYTDFYHKHLTSC